MKKSITIVSTQFLDESEPLSLEELCQALQAEQTFIIEMVEQELLEPQGKKPEQWQFDAICFKRAKTAMSFHRDLEVNLQGAALALDLLDEIESLNTRIKTLERFFKD